MKNVIELNDSIKIPEFCDVCKSGRNYTSYGDDNMLPQFLYDLYTKSATLQSIINGTADFVFGEEFKANKIDKESIKKVIIDYLIFGGFAIQVFVYNKKVYKAQWIDFLNCRKNIDETKVYYSRKWGSYGHKSIVLDMYNGQEEDGTYVVYFKGHKTRGIYPIPMYVGALKSIMISAEISNFHLNNIMNGFNSNIMLNFNNGQPDPETQDIIEQQVRETFCGTDNAGRMMITYNTDKEHAVSIERIQSDDFDEKYKALADYVRQDIFVAFRATPNLFGLPNETTGFNTQEFNEAFKLYNKTVVMPIQSDLKEVFESLDMTVEIKPFVL